MTLIALIGPHGAGKTTFGRALAARLGWRFDDEIGRRLMEQGHRDDVGADARLRPVTFDMQVFAEERRRDLARLGQPRIVETWHPGNLAYAYHRNPELGSALEAEVRGHIGRLGPVLVIPLMARVETLSERFSEAGSREVLVAFFLEVASKAMAVATRLGLRVAATRWTDPPELPGLAA